MKTISKYNMEENVSENTEKMLKPDPNQKEMLEQLLNEMKNLNYK